MAEVLEGDFGEGIFQGHGLSASALSYLFSHSIALACSVGILVMA